MNALRRLGADPARLAHRHDSIRRLDRQSYAKILVLLILSAIPTVLPGFVAESVRRNEIGEGATEAANVRNFGAVGDGMIDDTAAIQTALSSAFGRIYVPDGTYLLRATLRIPSNKQLTLSPGAIMLRGSNSLAMLLNQSDGVTTNYSAAVNILVEGGVWDGNAALFPGPCTILGFGHASDVTVRDCAIVNTPIWHGIELNAVRRAVVERVQFKGCPNEALQLDSMNSANPGVFPWFGPYNDEICRDLVIQDCTFDAVATAIGSHSAPPVDGLVIRRCVVTASSEVAIKPVRYVNWRVEECEFVECHSIFGGSAERFELRANRVSSSSIADFNLLNWSNGIVEGNVVFAPRAGFTNFSATVVSRDNRVESTKLLVEPRLLDGAPPSDFFYVIPANSGNRINLAYQFVGRVAATLIQPTGGTAILNVAAVGSPPLLYRWSKGGVSFATSAEPRLVLSDLSSADESDYSVTVSNMAGSVSSDRLELRIVAPASPAPGGFALSGVSIRAQLSSNQEILSAGFSVRGIGVKRLLIRASGPALGDVGVSSFAVNPRLEIFDPARRMIAENDDWLVDMSAVFSAVGAFPWRPGSADAAAQVTIPIGSGTVQVKSTGPGVVLIEVLAVPGSPDSRLGSVSVRGLVGARDAVLIAGFTPVGLGSRRILIRGIGPRLAFFGVPAVLGDPRLELYASNGALIATNDDWGLDLANSFSSAGAFALESGSKDAALLVRVAGGAGYSAVLRGASATIGEALLEIYEIPE